MASIDLNLSTGQKQLLSQQMLQSLQILQMSAAELESYIEDLALENPVIELAGQETHTDRTEQMELQRKLDWLSSADPQNHVYYQSERDAEDPENNWQDRRSTEETLEDYLRSQLLTSPCAPEEQGLMDCLLNSLDSRGWFTDSLAGTAALYGFPEETAERLLGKIQSLDPAGVGARSLSECLLLQLERNPDSSETAKEIVRNRRDRTRCRRGPRLYYKRLLGGAHSGRARGTYRLFRGVRHARLAPRQRQEQLLRRQLRGRKNELHRERRRVQNDVHEAFRKTEAGMTQTHAFLP